MTTQNQDSQQGIPVSSFREMKEQQLQRELEPSQPAPLESMETTSPGEEDQEDLDAQRQPDDELLEESDEDQPEGGELEGASEDDDEGQEPDDDDTQHDWQAQVEQAREQAEKAESNLKSFERDYRHKTTAIAEKQRALAADREHLEEFGRQIVYQKQSALNEFAQVPWGELQVNDPQRYAQLKAQHDQVAREAQFEQQRFQGFMKQKKAEEDQARQFEIENSKAILKRAIPDWGPEKYGQIRDFAVENYGFTEEAIESLTDWSVMLPLHDAMVASQVKSESKKVLKKVGKRRTKRPGQTAGGQPRNAQGQYQAAVKESAKRPGDRDAWREATRLRLEAERRR